MLLCHRCRGQGRGESWEDLTIEELTLKRYIRFSFFHLEDLGVQGLGVCFLRPTRKGNTEQGAGTALDWPRLKDM